MDDSRNEDFGGKLLLLSKASMNHIIGECERFKALLQRMMDQGENEFFERIMEGLINAIIDAKFVGEFSEGKPRPLTIFFEDGLVLMADVNVHPPKLIVEVPSLFPYTDNKMVPWSYHCNYVNGLVVANILRIGGMTRSGRCYALAVVETIPLDLAKELPKSKESKISPDLIKELIIENEIFKFLKFIKHSEYSVVEQLNKLLARISLLALLMNFEPHRKALMKVLSETCYSQHIGKKGGSTCGQYFC